MMASAVRTEADLIVFDLEDAVAADAKDDARDTVKQSLRENDDRNICVRINPLEVGGQEDLDVLKAGGRSPDSILVPKVDTAADVTAVMDYLGPSARETDVFAIVETARGIQNVNRIARAEGVRTLVFGAEDYAAELGAERTKEGFEVLYARQRLITAAAANGRSSVDTVFTDLDDHDGLRKEARMARQMGFDGKTAIHPSQIPVINEVFTPADEQIAWASRVAAANKQQDRGAFRLDDEMIDRPVIARANDILERAAAAGIDVKSISESE